MKTSIVQKEKENKKVVCVPFYPQLSNKLKIFLKKHDVMVVTKTTITLSNETSRYKDKTIKEVGI